MREQPIDLRFLGAALRAIRVGGPRPLPQGRPGALRCGGGVGDLDPGEPRRLGGGRGQGPGRADDAAGGGAGRGLRAGIRPPLPRRAGDPHPGGPRRQAAGGTASLRAGGGAVRRTQPDGAPADGQRLRPGSVRPRAPRPALSRGPRVGAAGAGPDPDQRAGPGHRHCSSWRRLRSISGSDHGSKERSSVFRRGSSRARRVLRRRGGAQDLHSRAGWQRVDAGDARRGRPRSPSAPRVG